jgi:ferrochelatase
LKGILLLAYGGPGSLEELPAFLDQVRGGRPYTDDFLAAVTERYRSIGGASPMPGIVRSVAERLGKRCGLPAYVGMLHSSPSIDDAVDRMARDGVSRALALCMAPHYSAASIGRYQRRLAGAAEARGLPFTLVEHWHTAEPYVQGLAASIQGTCAALGPGKALPHVVFSAHSLPKAALPAGDPYEAQLRETAGLVAKRLGIWDGGWTLAFQSVSGPADEWLGPSVEQIVRARAERGEDHVVVCPCGFLADQVEVLHDLDIALRRTATGLGVTLLRTPLLNDRPAVIDSLAGLVEGWDS